MCDQMVPLKSCAVDISGLLHNSEACWGCCSLKLLNLEHISNFGVDLRLSPLEHRQKVADFAIEFYRDVRSIKRSLKSFRHDQLCQIPVKSRRSSWTHKHLLLSTGSGVMDEARTPTRVSHFWELKFLITTRHQFIQLYSAFSMSNLLDSNFQHFWASTNESRTARRVYWFPCQTRL